MSSEILDRLEQKGFNEGLICGRYEAATLAQYLINCGRQDELKRLSDVDYFNELLIEIHGNN